MCGEGNGAIHLPGLQGCRAAGAKSASSQIKDVEVSRFIENHLCGKNSQTGRYLIGELETQNSFGQSSLSQEGKGHYKQT